MANANPSRLGQINLTGDPKALFLKQFAGEVLTAFDETNVFLAKTLVRTITSGKSAQFPASWKGTAGYHTPGTELVGSQIAASERVITIDDVLLADRFIASIDEAMNHYDVRREYSRDIGRTLSGVMDHNIAQVVALAARASATVTGGPNGTVLANANVGTNADALISAIFSAAEALDRKDVPTEDRVIALSPTQYYLLINSGSKAINSDYNAGNPNGGVASGRIFSLAGMPIEKTNNLPNGKVVSTGPSAYQGDFTKTVALVFHRSAVGTVKLLDLKMEMEYDIRRQGTLMVGKYACGHGILRPECAVEIATP